MISRFQAILFDFDGVLGKTMEDNFDAWKLAMADVGVVIKPQDYFPAEGTSLKEMAKMFCKKGGLDESRCEEIIKKKEQYYLKNHSFALYPGVEDIISRLHERDILMAVVTAALLPRLEASVPKHFLEKFKVVVTGDKIERGKPFPDPYLEGARKLSTAITSCIVVENAPIGIQSAKAAGAYCIAIASTLPKETLAAADETVESFKDLKKIAAFQGLLGE